MKRPHILGIISSMRSCVPPEELSVVIQTASSFDDITEYIYKRGGDQKMSNSEALLLASVYGAKEFDVKYSFLNLGDYFSPLSGSPTSTSLLSEEFGRCSGLILSSPVYFGDRSSFIADFIQYFKEDRKHIGLGFDGRSVGVVSVGAKRNGGQETTNIYALADCLDMGACVVGNGPPTSQYGGTGWGGALGGIIDDHFGLSTAKGTGQRVGLLSKVLSLQATKRKIRVLVIITRNDSEGHLLQTISNLQFSDNVELEILDISRSRIKRCLACRICPNVNSAAKYKCAIPAGSELEDSDDMHKIHGHLVNSDGLIIAQYHGKDAGPDNFQVFMERTRFVRRNDFELADRAFSSLTLTDSLTDIFPLRAMTSFLRHNMFIVGPFYRGLHGNNGKIVLDNISLNTFIERFENITKKTRHARDIGLNVADSKYEAIGYPD